jgi:hypothetical protein
MSPSRYHTAYVDKNLGDVAHIPARWDAHEQFHPGTAPYQRPSPALQPHCFCFLSSLYPCYLHILFILSVATNAT